MGKLIDKLIEYGNSATYPFHMPGHKRQLEYNINPYKLDITEINDFDDLSEPEDILSDLQKRIAILYGCKEAFILVNGSTSGVLAGISASLKNGETILLARNSHKSAYNAVFLRQLRSEYVIPKTDNKLGINLEITPESVEKELLSNPQIKAVFITSPTYEGIISDIESISHISHKYGAILIVDCAHGAHLGIDGVGKNPVNLGADIVIMSLHKTLPSPTQTAVICVNDSAVDTSLIKKFVNIYNSSSPSYLLMAGIENCIDIIQCTEELFKKYYTNLYNFRKKCDIFSNLKLYNYNGLYDNGKILISTANCNINGKELAARLRADYRIETEMSSCKYVLAMSSCMDSKEAFDKLFEALKEIDESISYIDSSIEEIAFNINKKFESCEIEKYNLITCDLEDAEGEVCGEYIYLYPPGVPWVVPGEVITSYIIEKIHRFLKNGFEIRGITDNKVQVIER